MALKNTRIGTDQRFALSLSNAGAKVNMNDVEVLHLCMYSNDQRSNDGSISYAVNADDATVLDLLWSAKSQCYLGSHSVHGTIRYSGAVASFDIPAVNVVSLTSEADISTDTIVLEAPVGTEDLTATITIQGMGPQGPKGDKMTYEDLSEADKEDIYAGGAEILKPLLATKANIQHQHTVADITNFPELYYDATAFFASGAYPSDKYEELLEAVKAKKTVYATLDEEGNISYVFFTSLANSDASSSRVLLTTVFVDGSFLYLNTFVLQQSGMTRLQENITGKANKATTLAGYGIADAYTKSEVDAALAGKQSTLTPGNGISIEGNVIGVTAITESESQPDTSLWLNPFEDEETDVTYNRSQIDAMLGAKQDALTLTVKDNGNIVLSNIQGQSKEFMPATPSGDPMHYAYEAAGAVWNGTGADIVKTGEFTGEKIIHKSDHWYYNELGDISNEQMRDIYTNGDRIFSGTASSMAYAFKNIRTNLFIGEYSYGSWLRIDLYSIAIGFKGDVLKLTPSKNYVIYAGRVDRSFTRCISLKKILGDIVLNNTYTDYKDIFSDCYKLEYVRLKGVSQNLSLSSSSYLQESSILYMINNETATSAITITLHADAYARAMANADIVTALEAHPNVSLASA